MAVQAVDKVTDKPTESTTLTPDASTRSMHSDQENAKMTASEIMEAYKTKNWAVPSKILTWAQAEVKKDPNSKTKYGESSGGATNDAVAYQETLEEQGMSLKEQCKQFTQLSSQKEVNDLSNVTKMAPFSQTIPTDQTGGDKGQSAVQQVLSGIVAEMTKGVFAFFSSKGREDLKFFDALKKGSSNEVEGYNKDLKEISSVVSTAKSDAKVSKQYGDETIVLGKELKSHTKWWQFFGSRRKAAKDAIEQGGKTIVMSANTTKLADAIAKDNKIALTSVEDNQKIIEGAEVKGGTPSGSPPSGTPSVTPTSGTPSGSGK